MSRISFHTGGSIDRLIDLYSEGNPQSMQVPQFPIYYSVNPQGLIQAGGTVGQPPNIMIPTGNVPAGGAAGSATSPVYYAGIYPGRCLKKNVSIHMSY